MDRDVRTRARLEEHWGGSERGDIETEHAIYSEDAILGQRRGSVMVTRRGADDLAEELGPDQCFTSPRIQSRTLQARSLMTQDPLATRH